MPEPTPAISLRPITAETFREATRLLVREDQRHFVATNAVSLAQMHFESEGFLDTGERDDDGEIVFRWTAPRR